MNEPELTPEVVWIVWVWQSVGLVGQWWTMRVHDRPLAGIVPSCWSVAPPENGITSPTA